MNKKKTDRRILYTKKLLRESLLELMKEKPIGKITPTELCRRADLNRKTFYSHYDSPQTLLLAIENELLEEVKRSLVQSWNSADMHILMTDICKTIYKNGDICTIIFSDYGDKDFLRRIAELSHDKCAAEWAALGIDAQDRRFELLFSYIVNGSVAVIEQWIADGMKESAEVIAAFIAKVSLAGTKSLAQETWQQLHTKK